MIIFPVNMKYDICVEANAGAKRVDDPYKINCPRVGECLCIPMRTQLVMAVEIAKANLAEFDRERA